MKEHKHLGWFFWGGKTIALIHKSALMRASVTTLSQMWLSNNRNVEKV